MRLVPLLAESADPTNEDVIHGVLAALFVQPVLSAVAEKVKYHDMLKQSG